MSLPSRRLGAMAVKKEKTDCRFRPSPPPEKVKGVFMTYLDLDEIDAGTQPYCTVDEVDDFPEDCAHLMALSLLAPKMHDDPPRVNLDQVQLASPDNEPDDAVVVSAGVSFSKPAEARSRIGCRAFSSVHATGSVTGQESPVSV